MMVVRSSLTTTKMVMMGLATVAAKQRPGHLRQRLRRGLSRSPPPARQRSTPRCSSNQRLCLAVAAVPLLQPAGH